MNTGWIKKTLNDVCQFRGGGTPSKSVDRYWRGDIPWVSPKDMKSKLVSDSIDHISEEAIKDSATNLIPRGSVLMVVRSGILARTIPIAVTGCDLAINQDLKALCPNGVLDARFLYYLLESKMDLLLSMVSRGATVHRLITDQIRSLDFLLPSLPEQQRIVSILDKAFDGIATARANAEKNLQNARALFESHLYITFNNHGPEWIDTSVGELVERGILEPPLDGNHGELHPKKADFVSSGVPFIMASDLKDGLVDQKSCYFISEKQASSLRKGFAKNGDVLLSHKGTIGRTALLLTDHKYVMLTPQVTYYRITNGKALFNRFLFYIFQNPVFIETMNEIAGTGSTRAYIGITKQQELPISFPPFELQVKLATQFDELSAQAKRLESIYKQKLLALGEMKVSLLHQAFTGQL